MPWRLQRRAADHIPGSRLFLQDYVSLAEVDHAFNAVLPDLSTIVNAADKDGACSYESSLSDTRRREAERSGLLAATNHFVGSTWKISPIDDTVGSLTMERRTNLLKLGEKYKGRFSPTTMMTVLDTPIDRDGATVDGTIYQVIAVPARLTLWIKVPGFQDWTEIELGPLFTKN